MKIICFAWINETPNNYTLIERPKPHLGIGEKLDENEIDENEPANQKNGDERKTKGGMHASREPFNWQIDLFSLFIHSLELNEWALTEFKCDDKTHAIQTHK